MPEFYLETSECEDGIDLADQLRTIQCVLQDIGSHVATPFSSARETHSKNVGAFDASRTSSMETWIDSMTAKLPPLTNFILPSGGRTAASLHCARTICRFSGIGIDVRHRENRENRENRTSPSGLQRRRYDAATRQSPADYSHVMPFVDGDIDENLRNYLSSLKASPQN